MPLPVQLYVRRKNFYPPSRVSDYYAIVVSHVRTEAQSAAYKALDSSDFLTQEERDILRLGRNATDTSPKRLSQGGMTKEIYREATAIECLVRTVFPSRSSFTFVYNQFKLQKNLLLSPFFISFSQAGYLYLTDGLRLHELMIHLGIDSTEA